MTSEIKQRTEKQQIIYNSIINYIENQADFKILGDNRLSDKSYNFNKSEFLQLIKMKDLKYYFKDPNFMMSIKHIWNSYINKYDKAKSNSVKYYEYTFNRYILENLYKCNYNPNRCIKKQNEYFFYKAETQNKLKKMEIETDHAITSEMNENGKNKNFNSTVFKWCKSCYKHDLKQHLDYSRVNNENFDYIKVINKGTSERDFLKISLLIDRYLFYKFLNDVIFNIFYLKVNKNFNEKRLYIVIEEYIINNIVNKKKDLFFNVYNINERINKQTDDIINFISMFEYIKETGEYGDKYRYYKTQQKNALYIYNKYYNYHHKINIKEEIFKNNVFLNSVKYKYINNFNEVLKHIKFNIDDANELIHNPIKYFEYMKLWNGYIWFKNKKKVFIQLKTKTINKKDLLNNKFSFYVSQDDINKRISLECVICSDKVDKDYTIQCRFCCAYHCCDCYDGLNKLEFYENGILTDRQKLKKCCVCNKNNALYLTLEGFDI